jgi:hypothetical protein
MVSIIVHGMQAPKRGSTQHQPLKSHSLSMPQINISTLHCIMTQLDNMDTHTHAEFPRYDNLYSNSVLLHKS